MGALYSGWRTKCLQRYHEKSSERDSEICIFMFLIQISGEQPLLHKDLFVKLSMIYNIYNLSIVYVFRIQKY